MAEIEIPDMEVEITNSGEHVCYINDLCATISYDDESPDDWEIVDIENEDREGRRCSLKGHAIYAAIKDAMAVYNADTISAAIEEDSGLEYYSPRDAEEASVIGCGEWRAA